MSGGAFDYLYLRSLDEFDENIERMADRLRELGAVEAADETQALLRKPSEELRALWKAVELHDSGDTGVDALRFALILYKR